MDKGHPLSSPMVVRSLDVKKDPFRPCEKGEELLGPEVPYLSVIGALMYLANCTCHAPNPGPTRLTNPNQIRGARSYTGTLYLFFFFLKPNLYLWVWPTYYNNSKYHIQNFKIKLPPWWCLQCYIHAVLSLIYIYKNYTFTFTNQSSEPTCSEPLQVCWPSCMRMLSDVFFCTYTD